MDRAKVQGGNSYQFYTAGGTTRALKQLVLESNLRGALERSEFVVHYQPQVDTRSFQLVGHGSARALAASESRTVISE